MLLFDLVPLPLSPMDVMFVYVRCVFFVLLLFLLLVQDHSCVKIPKDMDFSVINKDPPHIVKGFDAKQLQGTWYKVSRLLRLSLLSCSSSNVCLFLFFFILVLVLIRFCPGSLLFLFLFFSDVGFLLFFLFL